MAKQALAISGGQMERRLTDKHQRRQEGGFVMHKTIQEPRLTLQNNNELVQPHDFHMRASIRSKRTDMSSSANSLATPSYKFYAVRTPRT